MSGRIAWLKRLSTLYRLVAPHCLRAFFRHRPFVFQIYGFILFNFPRSQPAFAHFSTLKPDNLLRKKKKKEEDSQIIFKKKKVAYLYNIIYNITNKLWNIIWIFFKNLFSRSIQFLLNPNSSDEFYYFKYYHLEDSSKQYHLRIWIIEINWYTRISSDSLCV